MKLFKNTIKGTLFGGFILLASAIAFFAWNGQAEAAVLRAVPEQTSINIGDTFTVQLLLDTQDASINTVDVHLQFPADKLQITSPSSGNSIIEIYTTSPKINNQAGTIQLAGGIPGGINTKSGLIGTITFRAKSPGTAMIRFTDGSKALLNDGQGTDALADTHSAQVTLELPPPGGPEVSSDSHPSSDVWYRNKNAILKWEPEEGVEGYSYMISDQPTDTPDDIAEGTDTGITYRTLPDGVHYFHIRALREGKWGGTTHFAFKIDSSAPAEFPLEIIPKNRTIVKRPTVHFTTTDNLSGIDRYELKIVPLGQTKQGEESLFIEASSPHTIGPLELGSYELIVRAYDNAGNYRESSERVEITNINTWFAGTHGLQIRNSVTISWGALSLILGLLTLFLIWMLRKIKRWHHGYKNHLAEQTLPNNIQQQLNELKQYQSKYGKLIGILLAIFTIGLLFSHSGRMLKAEEVTLVPATITSFSEEVTDEEVFYVSGRTDDPETEVVINIQNTLLHDTYSYTTISDDRGDWSFRSGNPLRHGTYALWVQSKLGDELSPPSPQATMTVHAVAFNLGGSRITYMVVYLIIIGILSLAVLLLLAYIIYHSLQGQKRRREFLDNLRIAEESIKRGFAMLRRDITAELTLIREGNLSPTASAEEKIREEQIMQDLEYIDKYVGKEIWDTKKFEGMPEKKE